MFYILLFSCRSRVYWWFWIYVYFFLLFNYVFFYLLFISNWFWNIFFGNHFNVFLDTFFIRLGYFPSYSLFFLSMLIILRYNLFGFLNWIVFMNLSFWSFLYIIFYVIFCFIFYLRKLCTIRFWNIILLLIMIIFTLSCWSKYLSNLLQLCLNSGYCLLYLLLNFLLYIDWNRFFSFGISLFFLFDTIVIENSLCNQFFITYLLIHHQFI